MGHTALVSHTEEDEVQMFGWRSGKMDELKEISNNDDIFSFVGWADVLLCLDKSSFWDLSVSFTKSSPPPPHKGSRFLNNSHLFYPINQRNFQERSDY